MDARYYDSGIGRFVSQDPAFLAVGDNNQIEAITKQELQQLLTDPQALNSYVYTRNNPLKYVDETGEFAFLAPAIYAIGAAALMYAPQITSYLQSLTTPIGQYGLYQASQEAQKGNSGMAAIGVVTAGEVPEGRAVSEIGKVEGVVSKGINEGKSIFRRAAEHSVNDHKDVSHYLGKTVEEVEDIARNTYNNFDIKVNIKDVKKYFYNSKTNDLLINNPKNPTIFQPDRGLDYLKSTVKKDIERGGRVR